MDSIIFDVDGTLWDSTESVAQSWTAYLQEKEHMDITLTSARLMTLFGQTLSDIARQIFPDCSEAEQLRLIDGCCQAEHEAPVFRRSTMKVPTFSILPMHFRLLKYLKRLDFTGKFNVLTGHFFIENFFRYVV